MCAVPFNGLNKDDIIHKQLVKIQQLIKERIPTGKLASLLLMYYMSPLTHAYSLFISSTCLLCQ